MNLTTRNTPPRPAASASTAAVGRNPGVAIEPYDEFRGTLQATGDLTTQELVNVLRDIVAVEGPVIGHRLYDAFAQAYGRSHVTEEITVAVLSAIAYSVQRGALIQDAPMREREAGARTYRLPGQPDARPRTQGPRLFDDMPPLELANLLAIAAEEHGWHDTSALHREMLKMIGSTRLTADVASR